MVFAEALCAHVILSAPINPPLQAQERKLVCGDPSPGQEAWSAVPASEARFYLRNFLQARGYHHPKIEGDRVDPGPRARVTRLVAIGAPEGFDVTRRRRSIGQFLTPEALNEVERWAVRRLHALGYGCARAKVSAQPDTGVVTVSVEAGAPQTVEAVDEGPVEGLAPQTLRRYDAFAAGGPYDGNLVELSEERIRASETVQVARLQARCSPDPLAGRLRLRQETIAGRPRLLGVGLGVNTEGVLLGRASWRSVRLGRQGSQMTVTLQASAREQRLGAAAEAYVFPPSSSSAYLRPELTLLRQDELAFESMSARVALAPSLGWARSDRVFTASLGPAFDQIRTVRGTGPPVSTFASLEGRLNAHAPAFELYRTQPREGWDATLEASASDSRLLSDATVGRLVWRGQILWNVADFDPPLLVLGLRARAATILTTERAGPGTRLPATFLEYLGGSGDVRGFGRKELSLGGAGALSSLYVGLEARLGPALPFDLEPFAFIDAGALGGEPARWDSALYWSPGLGLRWPSPIGAIRATLALGFVREAAAHPQFYVGLGEEF